MVYRFLCSRNFMKCCLPLSNFLLQSVKHAVILFLSRQPRGLIWKLRIPVLQPNYFRIQINFHLYLVQVFHIFYCVWSLGRLSVHESVVTATSSICSFRKCHWSVVGYYFVPTIYLFAIMTLPALQSSVTVSQLLLNFSREIHHVRGQFKIALLPGAPALVHVRGRELDGRQIKDNPAHIDADIPLYFLLRYVHVDITRRR